MARVEISATDHGKSLVLHAGDELVVTLPENPTTGYRWELDSLGSGPLVVETDAFAGPAPIAAGAAGVRSLTLRATAAGRARLHLVLRRAWEQNKPLQDFSVSADVLSAESGPG
jgi:inhibitor of cysteine peptidase